jgi:uncharacterized metal-binding protein YceD (DUF177 family)
MAEAQPEPEFSRSILAERIGREEVERRIEADAAERRALARRLGLESLEGLKAELRLKRLSGGRIRVDGRFEAALTQLCVISLEPVESRIEAEFSVEYTERAAPEGPEAIVSIESAEPPEPIEGGVIDLGEAVVQQLAERIDPYPRAAGAEARWPEQMSAEAEEQEERPFAALAALKKRKGKGE